MGENDYHDTLKAAFDEADASLESAHFTRKVMTGLARKRFLRRSIFALAIAFGLLVAAPQLPSVLSLFSGVEGASALSVASLETSVRELAGVQPYWLFAGLVCVLSVLATFTMERV